MEIGSEMNSSIAMFKCYRSRLAVIPNVVAYILWVMPCVLYSNQKRLYYWPHICIAT